MTPAGDVTQLGLKYLADRGFKMNGIRNAIARLLFQLGTDGYSLPSYVREDLRAAVTDVCWSTFCIHWVVVSWAAVVGREEP